MDRIENGIENAGDAACLRRLRRAYERSEIAVRARHQNRYARRAFCERNRRLIEAQHVIGAGLDAAFELVRVGRIDADYEAAMLYLAHALLEMRERRVEQTAEIDYIGAG